MIDRGSGIDPKNLENIFNPFFTTKCEGVGLGLAIVSKIVDEHGGQITVESTPGEGSVFPRLPACGTVGNRHMMPSDHSGHRRRRKTTAA